MAQTVNHSLVLQPASGKKQESEASLPARLASALFGPKSGSVPKLDDYTIEPIAGSDFVDSNPFAEEEIDWSRRNDPAARLEGDLRAMPRNIIERIKNVEKILGKFPTIVLADDVPLACYKPAMKEIRVNKTLSHNKQLAYIIFELLNIEKLPECHYHCEEARLGFHTEKSLGEAIEKIEFENTQTHHRLVQGLPREFDLFRNCWNSFDEYLSYMKESRHINNYYKGYKDKGYSYFFGPAQTTLSL